jgi:hypothetical protein
LSAGLLIFLLLLIFPEHVQLIGNHFEEPSGAIVFANVTFPHVQPSLVSTLPE